MSVPVWIGIALLGGLGASCRYLIETALHHDRGLMVVNLIGCAVLGALAGTGVDGDPRRLVAVGFLGALTSFSGWALEDKRAGVLHLLAGLVTVAVFRALL